MEEKEETFSTLRDEEALPSSHLHSVAAFSEQPESLALYSTLPCESRASDSGCSKKATILWRCDLCRASSSRNAERVSSSSAIAQGFTFALRQQRSFISSTSLSGSDDEMEMDFLRNRYQEMHSRNFEVFLSFRGKDTRASFTSHLYTALQNAGIFVFKDDESLPRGKQISPSLQLGIEESQISIVVFSKNYAESFWCLKELEKIMECHRTIGNVVLPVFYDVDPSEVRHQRGDFGKAFQRLLSKFSKEEEEKVLDWKQRWWKTLREICDISAVEILSSRQ
ncbi:hypothetical protein V8G54_009566 [Vigna mungo]|uniref:TIR domain-containing protein n=1 Tax=Vigna mungo TaxID=3915 RepID=A0AAQ3S297_VIGMU